MKILPFQPDDLHKILPIHRENYEDLNLERFLWQPCQQIESLEKDCFKIVCKEESVKGYAAVYVLDETHFRLNLLVAPKSKRCGIGTMLFREVEREAKNKGCLSLQARTLESMAGGLGFAVKNDFREVHRMCGMTLLRQDFSSEKWRELGKQLAKGNFTATTLAQEIEAGRPAIEKLVELHKYAVQGWALVDPTAAHNTNTKYLTEFFSSANRPERVSIIKHGENYIGYTSADRENVIGTAVHPDYRGRGLATYLKAFDLKMQFDDGTDFVESATANPAMVRVNEKLGYQFNGLTEIRLVKIL